MSEIINLDNSFKDLHITKFEQNIDSELMKNIEEGKKNAEWVTMDEDQINSFMNNFIEYSDENGIEWEKFDYEVFGYSYYKERFPKFDDEIIDILVKCSEKKIYNDNKPEEPVVKKPLTQEDFIVSFD